MLAGGLTGALWFVEVVGDGSTEFRGWLVLVAELRSNIMSFRFFFFCLEPLGGCLLSSLGW